MVRILKSIKGVTLIELMVSLVLLTVIMSLAFSIFYFSHKSHFDEVTSYEMQNDVRLATDYIIKQIRTATELEIITDADMAQIVENNSFVSGWEYIYIDGQTLRSKLWNGSGHNATVFAENLDSTSNFTNTSNNVIKITVAALNNNKEYQSEVLIHLDNTDYVENAPGISGSTGTAIKFRFYDEY